MDRFFLRRYNNTVVFCMGLVAASVVGAIIYWMYFSKEKKTLTLKETKETSQPEIRAAQSKPALVLFYSENCGHCVEMRQSWSSAADVLRKAGLVDVLEFEASKDIDTIKMIGDVTGFPDIRLYPEGFPSKNYIKYSGERSEDSFIQFAYSVMAETPV